MSRKIDRLQSEMSNVLSSALIIDANNKVLKDVFITNVLITPDLSDAKILYSSYNEDKELLQNELNRSIPFFRKIISDKMNLRHTPNLTFTYDESIHHRQRIEEVLKEINDK